MEFNKRSGIFSRLPTPDGMMIIENEIRMWRAFIDQMLFDAYGKSQSVEDHDRIEASLWLWDRVERFTPDFYEVCDLAQVQSNWLELVLKKFENGETSYG